MSKVEMSVEGDDFVKNAVSQLLHPMKVLLTLFSRVVNDS